jgi:hypothetical protein
MPGLRFAIGAVLAIALLIVAVFGLAATVQMAHRRSAAADDPWRTLAYPDPTDWGLLADRSRPAPISQAEAPQAPLASVAAPAPALETTVKTSERVPQDAGPQDLLPEDAVPRELEPQAVPQEAKAAEVAQQPTLDTPPATIVAAVPPAALSEPATAVPERPVDSVAAIPQTNAAPVQPADMLLESQVPHHDDEPLEPSERVGMLPGFPTAGHGFVPPEHPIALPVPLPVSRPDIKKPPKKKVARSRPRPPSFPFANTGYPQFGFDKNGPDYWTNYDKKWSVE